MNNARRFSLPAVVGATGIVYGDIGTSPLYALEQSLNAAGGFSFPFVGLYENAQLRVTTVGNPVVVSPIVTEGVAVAVSFRAHRFRRHHHSYVRLFGTVTPAEPGALVGFQLVTVGGHTVNVGGTSVKTASGTTSRFSRTVRVRHRGLYRALVKINDGGHVSAYSAPVLVR